MKNINIVLAQPGYRSGPAHLNNWYLPYSIGCLWAHAIHDPIIRNNSTVIDWVWQRPEPETLVQKWQKVDVLFCSVYIWNENYCSALSQAVKSKWPDAVVIWGGPQCDHSNDDIFKLKPFIDVIAVSEGEQTFQELCVNLINNQPLDEIQSCVINQQQKVKRNPLRPRSNLDNYPSPYLSGVFDSIIDQNPQVSWSVILETNRGCPYSCTFCDWGSLTASKVKKFNLDKVLAEIEWFADKKVKFIMTADANFGIFKERDVEIAKAMKKSSGKNPHLEGISFAFLKNKTDSIISVAREVKDLMHNGLTLSVQSLDPHTLKMIKRDNMEINDIGALMKKLTEEGIGYYTELILGLPGETLESWKQNIWKLYEAGFHKGIAVYQLISTTNTEMNQRQKEEHQMVTRNVPVITSDNHIEEFAPTVVSSKTMPYKDYLDAWVFTKVQNLLHCTGFSLDASVACNQKGIGFEKFYDTLKHNLNQHSSWQEAIKDMTDLFDKVFSEDNQSVTEKQIDAMSYLYVIKNRELVFDCVDQTLAHYKIENKQDIIKHAKALVYDPLQPHLWPQTVDSKTYYYAGLPVSSAEEYIDLQTHRRNSIFVKVK